MRRIVLALATAASILTLAGCSQGSGSSPTTSGEPTHAAAQTPSLSTKTSVLVMQELAKHVVTMKPTKQWNAGTDPNHLLGRPGGYVSSGAFADSRVPADYAEGHEKGDVELGGSIEVFPTAAEATQRSTYIQSVLQGANGVLGSEYDYTSGQVLLRISGGLTPSQAKGFGAALPAAATAVLGD